MAMLVCVLLFQRCSVIRGPPNAPNPAQPNPSRTHTLLLIHSHAHPCWFLKAQFLTSLWSKHLRNSTLDQTMNDCLSQCMI